MFPKENQACTHTGRYMVHVQHYAKIQRTMRTLKVERSIRWRKKRQRVSYLETPSLIPPHPSTCTQVSDLTLLGYWPFPKVPSIVASPGGPSFFAPSFNKLLLPLFPLPSTDRKAAALSFSDVHHSALNVIHKLKLWKMHKTTKKAKHSQNRFEGIRKTAIINNVGTRGVSLRNHSTLSKFPDVQGGQAITFNSWRI